MLGTEAHRRCGLGLVISPLVVNTKSFRANQVDIDPKAVFFQSVTPISERSQFDRTDSLIDRYRHQLSASIQGQSYPMTK